MANFMTWMASRPSFSPIQPQKSGPVINKFADRWINDAATYGRQAGVDPRLVVAIMLNEGVDFNSSEGWALEKATIDAGRKNSIAGWARRHAPEEWYGNPDGMSLGIVNMKKPAFDAVKASFPDQFKDAEWTDLATDHDLAIKALTYSLARYDKSYADQVSTDMKSTYSQNQFLAAAYYASDGAIGQNIAKGYLGHDGASYADGARNNFAEASNLVSRLYTEVSTVDGGVSNPGMPSVSRENPATLWWDYEHDRPGNFAEGGDVDSDRTETPPGESLYNGMFALDGVSGSRFWNGMASALGETAYESIEKAIEAADPAAGAAWEAVKTVAQPLQSIGSTAGKLLRIHGRIPNLDPHVYGNDGPLSTAGVGTLFHFLDPLKGYIGGKIFSGVSEQAQKALSGNNNDDSGDDSSSDGQQNQQPPNDRIGPTDTGAADIGQLARTALQNAGRVITSFTTPAIIAPPNALGTNVQVNRAFSITMDLPPNDPLFTRDRRNDAVLAFGRR